MVRRGPEAFTGFAAGLPKGFGGTFARTATNSQGTQKRLEDHGPLRLTGRKRSANAALTGRSSRGPGERFDGLQHLLRVALDASRRHHCGDLAVGSDDVSHPHHAHEFIAPELLLLPQAKG